MIVSLIVVLAARVAALGFSTPTGADFAIIALIGVFYAGSRDTLRKYYLRGAMVVGTASTPQSQSDLPETECEPPVDNAPAPPTG